MYKVTYLNPFNNERYALLDKLTMEEAIFLKAKWGGQSDPNYYLPDVQIEKEDEKV